MNSSHWVGALQFVAASANLVNAVANGKVIGWFAFVGFAIAGCFWIAMGNIQRRMAAARKAGVR